MARKKVSARKQRGTKLQINKKEQQAQVNSVLKLYNEMAKDVDKTLSPLLDTRKAEKLVEYATDASVTETVEQKISALRRKWDKRFSKLAETFTAQLVSYSKGATARALNNTLKKAGLKQTIKVSSMSQRTRDIISAASAESTKMIKTISTAYMDSASSALNYSVTQQSASLSELKQFFNGALKNQYRTHKNKAKNLALDQTRNIFNSLASERMRDAGMTKYIWRHSSASQKPREYHRDELAGKVFDINDPPIIDKKTGQKGNPGDTYNCFPPESVVSYFYGVRKAFRHLYTGESSVFVTNNGSRLECTPNHPILTDRGWVAAHMIKSGDYVVDVKGGGFSGLYGNAENVETSISNIFNSLSLFGDIESRHSTGGDLHGDVTDDKIDIVRADWKLGADIEAVIDEEVFNLSLAYTDVLLHAFPSDRKLDLFIKGSCSSSNGVVSSLSKLLSLIAREIGHSNKSGFSRSSNLESIFFKAFSNSSSRDLEDFRHFKNTFLVSVKGLKNLAWHYLSLFRARSLLSDGNPSIFEVSAQIGMMASELGSGVFNGASGKYKFSRVIDNGVGNFSTHVYNLEMDNGIYIANDIAVSNCHCYKELLIDFEAE